MSTLTFRPIRRIISSVTQANPGVITTTTSHGYFNGLYVRVVLPGNFGMPQLNGNVYQISIVNTTSFSLLNTDTSSFDAFNAVTTTQSPQSIPVAEISSTFANAERNNLTPYSGI